MPKEVCYYPRFAPKEQGGVAVHIRMLAKHLTARGWDVVDTPDQHTLVHAHAQARANEVHVYTNHGIYPLVDKMVRWQIETNNAIFENLKLAREVIAVSQWTADQWRHLIGREPHIIYNGIDLKEWQKVPKGVWRGRLSLPDKKPLVVWGKMGVSGVLDPTPLAELALSYPNWQFVAPLKPQYLGIHITNLACIGPQPFELMQALLQDCDVYLATVQENHSIQVLEAMALNKPVLGYAWGGTAETVTQGGILVPPYALDELVRQLPVVYENRKQLGKEAHAHVAANFTIEKQVDALEGVYRMAQPKGTTWAESRRVKCSIVIPVYNKSAYVGETVLSALRQVNAPKYEIIVVDDGSTDDSLRQVKIAVDNDQRVRIFPMQNQGVSAARNFGISQAKGEYICCLDADDKIAPQFLNRLTAALDADPGLGIAYCDFTVFGNDENGMPVEAALEGTEYDFERLKRGNFLPCCNLFRKVAWERAGGYKPINPSWEDYELWLNMGKLGWYGRRVPGHYFMYRKVPKTGRDFESQGLEVKLRGIVNRYHRDMYAPLVSVVIPSYNHSHFVGEAINSVVIQTFPDWEIVVVDDGNEAEEADALRAVVEDYHNDDIRYVRLAQNSGLAAARNAGIELARGQWIVPLDADDKIAPTFIERTLKASEINAKQFAYTDSYLWWPDAETPTKELPAHDYDFDEALQRITWSCTILFAKDAWRQVGGYKTQMSEAGGWEDWEFAISLGEIGVCGVRVPEFLFYYRQHSTEQMRLKAEQNKGRLQETIRRLHAEIYRGERTNMCCGAGKRSRQAPLAAEKTVAPPERTIPPVARGMTVAPLNDVLIRYIGSRTGTQTWIAPSGTRYRFGLAEPLQRVKGVDVDFFLQHQHFQRVTS